MHSRLGVSVLILIHFLSFLVRAVQLARISLTKAYAANSIFTLFARLNLFTLFRQKVGQFLTRLFI
jgi:hypothetical protein